VGFGAVANVFRSKTYFWRPAIKNLLILMLYIALSYFVGKKYGRAGVPDSSNIKQKSRRYIL
jgi:hypothetical protein